MSNKKIILLRGINVSGQKKIKMAELRAHLENHGFKNVQTYIQSGNIVVKSEKPCSVLESTIAQLIKKEYGYDVEVIARTKGEWEAMIKAMPYEDKRPEKISLYYQAFLKEEMSEEQKAMFPITSEKKEQFIMGDRIIYCFYPEKYGRTKYHNNYFERTIKIPMTTRNWKTVMKLWEMVQENND